MLFNWPRKNMYNMRTGSYNKFTYENGSRLVIHNGSKFWYDEDNYYHKIDEPAIEYKSGSKEWYIHGRLHREDGPAYIGITGDEEYWINGKQYSSLEEGLMDQALE